MYQYSIAQWFLFFYVYCFLGWCVESVYVSVKDFHPVNRGFLKGPFLPLYGSGAVVMLVASMPFRENVFLTFLAGCVGATILEYITGVTMEKLFKVRYWDYTRLKFNFQGQICLGTTLSWGALTVLLTYYLHKPVESFVLRFDEMQVRAAVAVLSVLIGIDFIISFRAAIDLKHVLIKMDHAKKELLKIQKRITEMLEYAGNLTNGIKEGISSKTSNFAESVSSKLNTKAIEEKFSRLSAILKNRSDESKDQMLEAEMIELKEKYEEQVQPVKFRNRFKQAVLKRMIRSNPDMTSGKFHDSLEELKAKFGYRKKDK